MSESEELVATEKEIFEQDDIAEEECAVKETLNIQRDKVIVEKILPTKQMRLRKKIINFPYILFPAT